MSRWLIVALRDGYGQIVPVRVGDDTRKFIIITIRFSCFKDADKSQVSKEKTYNINISKKETKYCNHCDDKTLCWKMKETIILRNRKEVTCNIQNKKSN